MPCKKLFLDHSRKWSSRPFNCNCKQQQQLQQRRRSSSPSSCWKRAWNTTQSIVVAWSHRNRCSAVNLSSRSGPLPTAPSERAASFASAAIATCSSVRMATRWIAASSATGHCAATVPMPTTMTIIGPSARSLRRHVSHSPAMWATMASVRN